MDTPTLVVLSSRGRLSLDLDTLARLDRWADVRGVSLGGPPGPEEAAALLADADVLGSTNLCLPVLDADLLDRTPRLRTVVLYATGHDHVDSTLLAQRGIALSVVPGYATIAVAEHALAMLFALATRLHLAHDRSRGLRPPDVSLRGSELAGTRVGVVGAGRIGRRVARLARGMGLRVIGTDVDIRATVRARAAGITMTDLGTVLDRSDAVIVCASHRYGAPPIIGETELRRLRPGALLATVSRAATVDTGAVVAAIRSRHLRGYAVDDVVLDPDGRDDDLAAEGRILQTGHSAWWRDEVLERGARMWGERLVAAVQNRPTDVVASTRPRRSARAERRAVSSTGAGA